MELVLASTSRYRQQLLSRLQLPFRCQAPAVDETPHSGESARQLAERLSLCKARAVARQCPGDLVIGSDQSAANGDTLLDKPGNHARAVAQLARCSGRSVHFYTGVALVCLERELELSAVERVTVRFRALGGTQIEDYLSREQPYDCAGSFKCEGLGIALFERIESRDPTALEGLPLITLCALLQQAGMEILN